MFYQKEGVTEGGRDREGLRLEALKVIEALKKRGIAYKAKSFYITAELYRKVSGIQEFCVPISDLSVVENIIDDMVHYNFTTAEQWLEKLRKNSRK